VIGASYGGAIIFYLCAHYPQLIGKGVSIEGGVVKPSELPGSSLETLLKYPVLGDALIGLVRTGGLNRVLVKAIAGAWYPHMTPQDRQELLEQLHFNARSASRIPWYWISRSHQTCEDFTEAAKAMQTPVLYLYGRASDFWEPMLRENLAFFEAHLPTVRAVGLEEGIHDLEFQKPGAVAGLIREFFAERLSTIGAEP